MARFSSLQRVLTLAIAIACVIGTSERVGATTLKELIDQHGFIDVGDKRFENFSIGSAAIDGSGVEVETFTVPDPTYGTLYGIRFIGVADNSGVRGPILSAAAGYDIADAVIAFDVKINPAEYPFWIHDVGLLMEAQAPNDGFAQVVESVYAGTTIVEQLQVDTPAPLTDYGVLASLYKQVHVAKDLLVMGGDQSGSEIRKVEQTFSQIPEPATLSLLALGAVAALRRRTWRGIVRMGRSSALIVLIIGVSVLMMAPDRASATLLKDLKDTGGTVVWEDKLFSNFDYSVITQTGVTSFDPAKIVVQGLTLGQGADVEYGLRFGGPIVAVATAANMDSVLKVQISFDVATIPTDKWIHDVSLGFNGALYNVPLPPSYATVTEEVKAGASTVGTLNVAAPSPLSAHLATLAGGNYKTLHIVKTIDLRAFYNAVAPGRATISIIDQTFSQVPEPATLGLLALGGLAMGLTRRRG